MKRQYLPLTILCLFLTSCNTLMLDKTDMPSTTATSEESNETWATGTTDPTTAYVPDPEDIIAVSYYSNHAWTPQEYGWLLTYNGNVYTFNMDKDEYTAFEDIVANKEPERTIDTDKLFHIYGNIRAIHHEDENGEYIGSMSNDAGTCRLIVYRDGDEIPVMSIGDSCYLLKNDNALEAARYLNQIRKVDAYEGLDYLLDQCKLTLTYIDGSYELEPVDETDN